MDDDVQVAHIASFTSAATVVALTAKKKRLWGNYRGVRILKDGVYQAHVRPSDQLRCRKEYVKKLYNGAFENRYDKDEEKGVKIFDVAEQKAKA
ncbi:unnamed protein product [Acanthoscelides obtectus]|uniref:Uncharacterized protein n=1 Tax=Acanthoscelides obtectus TaxID=200917 RepID=A0A9P0Q3Q9_ACAOB|nr:unnamed protein product [Acanthoscelides obtectus]CAK1668706.1 hypothetical protein AOBTE_LOCUS26549 [Acanthoscelides obtectus]